MNRAHKIALVPNNKARTYFAKACGVARFAYNWARDEWEKQYQAHKANPILPKPKAKELRKQLNAVKREAYPWMLEVTKCAPQQAINNLGVAYERYFDGLGEKPAKKKKGKCKDSFYLSNDQFSVQGKRLWIPNLGWVRMTEALRFSGKILSATISRTADRWFVSIAVDTQDLPPPTKNQGEVGLDLGITTFVTCSTGEKIPGPKPYRALLKRVRRLTRNHGRKAKGSKNRMKAQRRLSRLHARVANIRIDCQHKTTTRLTATFGWLGLETLNVGGIKRNRCLSMSISDMGFYEFRRQIEYKAELRGCRVLLADPFYASTKRCHLCQHVVAELPLKTREWTCPSCGALHDRDHNASINLRPSVLANLTTVSSTGSNACGETSSGATRKRCVKLPRRSRKTASDLVFIPLSKLED